MNAPEDAWGRTRPFGDVGSMSGLPRKRTHVGHRGMSERCHERTLAAPFNHLLQRASDFAEREYARELDHLGPLLGFVCDELAKIGA